MHALRPAAFLRSAFRNIPASRPISYMHKNAASPSTAFLFQQTNRQLQQQRFASSGLAAHFTSKAPQSSITHSLGIHSAFKNTSAEELELELDYGSPIVPLLQAIGTRSSYDPYEKDPIINTRELTFGTLMGLCSGYLFKKLGRMMMLVIGLGFVSLQLLTTSGYIHVNWGLIESRFKEKFDLDKDGKVTMNDARHGFRGLMLLLTRNFQFKSTFVSGFVLGFKYG
ncbi:hypothetical protein BG011_006514 [Mortierella polycephala]|uniref:FUN14 family-domain-containing protein n=1 Tax=Mortierella polycephala TaxID=41804 RepID=A0A9P6PUC8_9FUNG|nr:hypothetical protein BG011_006514 [Mortierella polycephala]